MMIIRKHLSRRTVLRGLGVTVALPFLDSMVPAFTALAKTAAKPTRRLGAFYLPNGMMLRNWTPKTEGSHFQLSPILTPLEPIRDQVVVLTGLTNAPANPRPGEGSGDHSRASATFLTGVNVKKTEGRDIQNGVSLDQIVARELGRETQLSSIELTLESNEAAGSCDGGYSCAYSSTVAWANSTTPLPTENHPRRVFERLLGSTGSTDPRVRAAQMAGDRSMLDSVTQEIGQLQKTLGPGDRAKLSQYLESVRDVERRIQRAEEQSSRELPSVPQPRGIPDTYAEHATLMLDLLVLAYQADLTRVCTFLMAREQSNQAYPAIGVSEAHHSVSHHQNDPEKIAKVTKIDLHHVMLFTQFAEKLKALPDGDGSILDHSMFIYGAGIGDGDRHDHENLAIMVVGGGTGTVSGGRHIVVKKDTPLTNLHLTLLEKMGMPMEKFGDSTGAIDLLSGV
jgi:hypothetical protein